MEKTEMNSMRRSFGIQIKHMTEYTEEKLVIWCSHIRRGTHIDGLRDWWTKVQWEEEKEEEPRYHGEMK